MSFQDGRYESSLGSPSSVSRKSSFDTIQTRQSVALGSASSYILNVQATEDAKHKSFIKRAFETSSRQLPAFTSFFKRLPKIASVTESYESSSEDSDEDTMPAFPAVVPDGCNEFVRYDPLKKQTLRCLTVSKQADMHKVTEFIAGSWNLNRPEVVLAIISSNDYHRPWLNASHIDDLKVGLIQAARLVRMWVLTPGLEGGIANILGEALAEESLRRKLIDESEHDRKQNSDIDPKLALLGIVPLEAIDKTDLNTNESGIGTKIDLTVKGVRSKKHKTLQENHTHFLLLQTSENESDEVDLANAFHIESRFLQQLSSITKTENTENNEHHEFLAPVVGLLVQGGPRDIERVLWLLKRQIPVIVIKSNTFAAGLIAYAYFEGMKGDSQYIDNIIKPQLMQRVDEAFPELLKDANDFARIQCRDKILECVHFAVQEKNRFLTIMDPGQEDFDYKDLSKFILTAIIASQKGTQEYHFKAKVHRYLRLALSWNRPDVATAWILNQMNISSFRVRDDLFFSALTLPDREAFVKLFLRLGYPLRRFVRAGQIQHLYEIAVENDFFSTICLQKILGLKKAVLPQEFVTGLNSPLNRLLSHVSGLEKLIKPLDADIESEETPADIATSERKALLELIMWSVLTNNQALTKQLWRRTSEPIAVALVISNMYYRISKFYITEIDLQIRTKEAAIVFGKLAIEAMDMIYADSGVFAFRSLISPMDDFNKMTVVDLALISNNKFFIAHPCCQRAINERWFGMIKIKGFGSKGFRVPEYLKIFFCLFLVFPIYFWLSFDTGTKMNTSSNDEEDTGDNSEVIGSEINKQNNNEKANYEYEYSRRESIAPVPTDDLYVRPSIWRKIYYLWTAPITKFWINQYFSLGYLGIYSYWLLNPFCGVFPFTEILCLWTLVIFIEKILRIIRIKKKFPTMSMFWAIVDCVWQAAVTFFFFVTLLQLNLPEIMPILISYMELKFLLSIGLILSCHRALSRLLPVSCNLGPMLVNITTLTRVDMIKWFQLWAMCLLSGGISLAITLYPARSFSFQVLRQAVFRGAMGIFLNQLEDIKEEKSCSKMYHQPNVKYVCDASEVNSNDLQKLEDCPHTSMPAWIIAFQFLAISRLVFSTLMFSMFFLTITKTKQRSLEIWKYQFFFMVTDYEARSVIPIPFTLLMYPFQIVRELGALTVAGVFECQKCCRGLGKESMNPSRGPYNVPYNQWKYYLDVMEAREEEKKVDLDEIIDQMEEQLASQKTIINRLNDRLAHVEKNQMLAVLALESLMTSLDAFDDRGKSLTYHKTHMIHTLSRTSPYPGTDIQRFPVFEKDVLWEAKFEAYDPVIYSKPIAQYPDPIQMWVDKDILNQEQGSTYEPFKEVYSDALVLPEPVFNSVQVVSTADGEEVIDRISYIMDDDNALVYNLDPMGLPINPWGRTGMRGRGALCRWGPNHMIQAVVSRWKTSVLAGGTTKEDPQTVKEFEILVVYKQQGGRPTLPGAVMETVDNPYWSLCDTFVSDVLMEENTDVVRHYDQDEMIHFFSQYASLDKRKKRKTLYANFGFSSFLVFRGYVDSPLNTDNSWLEAEVWNFHYKYRNGFENMFKDAEHVSWKNLSSVLSVLTASESAAVLEAAKIHDAT